MACSQMYNRWLIPVACMDLVSLCFALKISPNHRALRRNHASELYFCTQPVILATISIQNPMVRARRRSALRCCFSSTSRFSVFFYGHDADSLVVFKK